LSLVDVPDAARTGQEGEGDRAADWQEFGRPDDRHSRASARRTVVARAAAAETRGGEATIGPAPKIDPPPRAVAARAVDVQLEAVLRLDRPTTRPVHRELAVEIGKKP
jgi:hypothetical protein